MEKADVWLVMQRANLGTCDVIRKVLEAIKNKKG